jgi:hypothetical protein
MSYRACLIDSGHYTILYYTILYYAINSISRAFGACRLLFAFARLRGSMAYSRVRWPFPVHQVTGDLRRIDGMNARWTEQFGTANGWPFSLTEELEEISGDDDTNADQTVCREPFIYCPMCWDYLWGTSWSSMRQVPMQTWCLGLCLGCLACLLVAVL